MKREAGEAKNKQEGARIYGEIQETSQIPNDQGQKDRYLEAMLKNLGIASPDLVTKFREQTRKEEPKKKQVTLYGPKGKTQMVTIPEGEPYVPPTGWSLDAPPKIHVSTAQPTTFDKQRASAVAALKSGGNKNPTEEQVAQKMRDMYRGLNIEEFMLRNMTGGNEPSTNKPDPVGLRRK
jgi:hypothetical protein